jgi:hypothetical protein
MAGGDDDTDYEELIDGFSLEEAKVCCEDCGIEVAGDFELETIRLALKNRYCPVFATPAELFTQLDADGSGTLSIPEVQKAFALLGGMLLPRTAVEAKFAEIDTDGSGGLDSGEFEAWWLSYEAEEARKLEREWGVLKLQSAARGWVARQTVYKAHGFKYEGSRELQLPEAATALLYNLGDGPSDWVSVDDAMELIADGTIDETTDVWTEGMDEWLPLAQCRSRFGLGADE